MTVCPISFLNIINSNLNFLSLQEKNPTNHNPADEFILSLPFQLFYSSDTAPKAACGCSTLSAVKKSAIFGRPSNFRSLPGHFHRSTTTKVKSPHRGPNQLLASQQTVPRIKIREKKSQAQSSRTFAEEIK